MFKFHCHSVMRMGGRWAFLGHRSAHPGTNAHRPPASLSSRACSTYPARSTMPVTGPWLQPALFPLRKLPSSPGGKAPPVGCPCLCALQHMFSHPSFSVVRPLPAALFWPLREHDGRPCSSISFQFHPMTLKSGCVGAPSLPVAIDSASQL
jgi:hypothetical protein